MKKGTRIPGSTLEITAAGQLHSIVLIPYAMSPLPSRVPTLFEVSIGTPVTFPAGMVAIPKVNW